LTITIDHTGSAAIVTGAGAGIGREIARWLGRSGASLVVNDLDGERATRTAREIRSEGGTAVAAPGDLRTSLGVSGMIDVALSHFGALDIAVNNVGMTAGRKAGPFLDTPVEDAVAIIDQNLITTYRCCLAEAQVMATTRGGVILNVTSGETTRPSLGLAAYGAAKAAINHLTMTLAAELGPAKVRVNAIAPGTTFTDQVREGIGHEQFAAISASTPLGIECDPDELARLTVFLCSDLARTITGQTILADAGAHLGRQPLRYSTGSTELGPDR
jgi:NAD(P)-dependent dehydrogenase (short-subunit alcohol dehydrogenase family)